MDNALQIAISLFAGGAGYKFIALAYNNKLHKEVL